ncbi:MAG: tetratricopeptide repeat protein [Flavobacteriales bacterium]|nr:tetratricopeptide repeat protein [Flavobacteriales bacterium]
MRPIAFLFSTSVLLGLMACGTDGDSGLPTGPAEGSLAWLEQQIIANPKDAALFARRAEHFEGIDSLRLAEADWKRAIALDEKSPQYRIRLGDLQFKQIRLPDAEQRFQEAINLAPDETAARSKLSELYLAQNRFKEAMSVANEALRLDPLNGSIYNLKGWIHRLAGDTNLAISSYQTAVERDPGLYDAYVSLGLLHAARHDQLALEYYDGALAVRPNSLEALYNKAICAQDHGLDSMSLALYDRIKTIEPKYPLAYYNTGYILLEMRRKLPEARSQFSHAIALLPDYTDAYYNRGLTYELEGRLDSALADYRRALALAPDHTDAAKGLGRLESKGMKVGPR